MDKNSRRKELMAQYKEKPAEAGIYRIVNKTTGIYYLGSSMDLPGVFNRFNFAKKTGAYGSLPLKMTKDLQAFGFDGFAVEVLETLEIKKEMTDQEIKKELKLLEALWREEHGGDMFY